MNDKVEIIKELENFQQLLYDWESTYNPKVRSAINKKIPFVQKILRLTGTSKTYTIAPPPMVGGLVMKDVDPFTCIYEPPYGLSVVDLISDCIDEAIGFIETDDSFLRKMDSTEKSSQKKENKAISKISDKVFIVQKLFKLIYEYKKTQQRVKINILFINLPPSFRRIFPHSSVTMPASLLLHEEKSTRKPDETLIKK